MAKPKQPKKGPRNQLARIRSAEGVLEKTLAAMGATDDHRWYMRLMCLRKSASQLDEELEGELECQSEPSRTGSAPDGEPGALVPSPSVEPPGNKLAVVRFANCILHHLLVGETDYLRRMADRADACRAPMQRDDERHRVFIHYWALEFNNRRPPTVSELAEKLGIQKDDGDRLRVLRRVLAENGLNCASARRGRPRNSDRKGRKGAR